MTYNDEWLETNGLGSYASSTLSGMNTRRYHGLLIAAPQRDAERCVFLSSLQEELIIDGERFYLSTNQYGDFIHPKGYQYLKDFSASPLPTFTYVVGGVTLQKIFFLVYGQDTSVIQYTVFKNEGSKKDTRLELRPLTAFRNYHALTYTNFALDEGFRATAGHLIFKPYVSLPPLFFAHNAGEVKPQRFWYKNFFYQQEMERGLDAEEDLFNPCVFTFDLGRADTATMMVSLQEQDIDIAQSLKEKEILRRKALVTAVPVEGSLRRKLTIAADQFIVSRGGDETIIAGYHWFDDWGRDTMIALPGLALATERFDEAQKILLRFASLVDRGMLPNRFVEDGQTPEYNTVDAALWFFETVRQYAEHTNKWALIREHFYPVLTGIIDAYIMGTRYDIHMDEDNLIVCGQEGVQLTWMDAKIENIVVTPRRGKPVEIQALWFNALCFMQDLAIRYQDAAAAKHYGFLSQRAKDSFNLKFWNEEQGGLYDVISGDQKDDAIRPNQLFAISLFYPVLEKERFSSVMNLVEKELLTPVGLRTLSVGHPDYKGIYTGDQGQRDAAYHQGTVWPWLIGPYVFAYLRTKGKNPGTLAIVKGMLKQFEEHLEHAGLGQVSEIFDGDYPHAPKGCIAQAWSVGELLRILEMF